MEPLQKQEQEYSPKTILTSEAISIVLAEYKALRDEILKRKETQHQFASFALIALSTVIAFGLQTKNATLMLLYPILAMFLAIAWANQDRSVMLIAAYIRSRIEPKVGEDNMGWEHFVYAYHRKAEKGLGSWNILAMRGMFLATDLLAMFVGLAIATFNITIALIFAADIVSILITIIILRRVRLNDVSFNGNANAN